VLDVDMLDNWEAQEEDDAVIREMKNLKRQKSFSAVINRRKLSKYELDEVME
jgi:hypothetical protein